jgi:hypothetical protein
MAPVPVADSDPPDPTTNALVLVPPVRVVKEAADEKLVDPPLRISNTGTLFGFVYVSVPA